MTLLLLMVGTLSVLAAVFGGGIAFEVALRRMGRANRLFSGNVQGSLAFGSLLSLLLILTLNGWMPGTWLYPVSSVVGVAVIAAFFWREPDRARRWEVGGLITAAAIVCVVLQFGWYRTFSSHGFWLLEGPNHDMVFFFAGAKWAAEHALLVPKGEVAAAWNMGDCWQGIVMIGNDCPVYRGGTYTFMAMASQWVADASPNALRSTVGLLGLFPVLGLSTLEFDRNAPWLRWVKMVILPGLVSATAGMLCAITNENIGTAFGAAALAMMTFLIFIDGVHPAAKAMMLAVSAAIATHVYGEASIYACWLVATGVIRDAWASRRARWVIVGGAFSLLIYVVSLNTLLPALYKSFVAVSGLVGQNAWQSWFISANPVTWIAAPFTGLLMGGKPMVSDLGLVLGFALTIVTVMMGLRRQWLVTTSLLVLSVLMVWYIESRSYQYGEHKVIELLSPVWGALLCSLLVRDRKKTQPRAVSIVSMQEVQIALVAGLMLTIAADYLWRAREDILDHKVWALSPDFAKGLEVVDPGDEVVLDVSASWDFTRYPKQDMAVVDVHLRGGRVLMSHKVDGSMRAYSENFMKNGFARAVTPDWLVQLKAPDATAVIKPSGKAIRENHDYALYDLRDGSEPVALAGSGWYRCEPGHCWTGESYSVETFVPASCANREPRLVIQQDFYRSPANAGILVRVNDEARREVPLQQGAELAVDLPSGWSNVSVSPGWRVVSPADAGESGDNRVLFAKLKQVSVECRALP